MTYEAHNQNFKTEGNPQRLNTSDQNDFLEIERTFHDNYAKNLNWDQELSEFLSYEETDVDFIEIEKHINKLLGNVGGKQILDIGSGFGNAALNMAKKGALVTSIDISPKLIEGCKCRAKKNNLGVNFQIMDATNLKFEDNTFDIILGIRTIHHLQDIGGFLLNAKRCLKPGGFLLIVEPQKYNPFVEFGRRYIKNREDDRTSTEHPLVPKDLRVMKNIFGNLEKQEYSFLSAACQVFKLMRWIKVYEFSSRTFSFIDRILWYLPFLRPLYWQVVIKCVKMD
jgi:2-polyprenyl-3-methyl-5-hydroxy-6-metoxy-1,4-benzoquinol methylase